MRTLGEQWVEKDYGGKPHMYKAVGVNDKFDPCIGCCNQGKEEECYNAHSNCGRGVVIIKDLGPVNEDGCLREERSGQYPDISHDKRNGVYEAYLHATLINPAMSAVLVRVQASSMDRLKDAWNRRA